MFQVHRWHSLIIACNLLCDCQMLAIIHLKLWEKQNDCAHCLLYGGTRCSQASNDAFRFWLACTSCSAGSFLCKRVAPSSTPCGGRPSNLAPPAPHSPARLSRMWRPMSMAPKRSSHCSRLMFRLIVCLGAVCTAMRQLYNSLQLCCIQARHCM